MEKLTATAKPFIPQGTYPSQQKQTEISATAPPFIPTLNIAPALSVAALATDTKSIPKQNLDQKKGGKKKVNVPAKEKNGETAAAASPIKNKQVKSKSAAIPQVKVQVEQKKKQRDRHDKAKDKSSREEVRQLTSLLRDKEEKLKQMEALQSQESIAQSAALAKKVEEEVTQKLFKASLLSDMYKNSLSAAKSQPETSSSKKDQTKSSSKPSKPSSRGRQNRDREREQGRGDRDGRASGAVSGGGLLRVPASSPSATDDNTDGNSRSKSNISSSRDQEGGVRERRSERSGRAKEGGKAYKAYEMTPEELLERDTLRAVKERAATDRRIATLEAETKEILGQIRKSKPLLQDFCLLGISQGAPIEFVEKCAALETHYSSQLLRGARPAPPSTSSAPDTAGRGEERLLVQWAHQMCALWGQQTGLIRQVIDKAEKKGGIDDSSIHQIRNVFINELGIFVERMLGVVEPLEQILSSDYTLANITNEEGGVEKDEGEEAEAESMTAQEKQLRSAIQVFLLAIADMGRLQLLYSLPRANTATGNGSEDYLLALKREQVEMYQQRALSVAPHDGAPFASLSKMALRSQGSSSDVGGSADGGSRKNEKGDIFLSAYYLARGMGAEEPYLAAREALLDIFEDQKSVSESLVSVTALSRLTLSEHIQRYQVHFLAAVGVAYSRTGADRLAYHLTKARRHVGTMLQLLSTSQLSEQNRGSKGKFAAFDQKAFQKEGGRSVGRSEGNICMDATQVAQCREVDVCLCQSLVISLALIESVGAAHGIQEVCSESHWAAAYANWIDQNKEDDQWTLADHIEHIAAEEREVIENRYVLQRLHRVQSIPGLMDLLRLVVGLLASLLSTESIGNILDAERREGKQTLKKKKGGGEVTPRSLATTRMLALFLEWLQSHPQYHAAITVLNVGEGGGGGGWDNVEADLPQLVSGLCSLSDPAPPAQHCVTKDDVDLRGFVPLQTTVASSTAPLSLLERSAFRLFADPPSTHLSFESPQDYVRNNLVNFEQHTLTWVCHYAKRCCSTVRNLCSQPVRLGEMTFHVDATTGKRQALLPSGGASTELTVIVYRTAASAPFLGFNGVLGKTQGLGSRNTNFLLSKEAFMSGAVMSEPEEEEEQENEDEEDDDSVGVEEEGDVSSLSDEGEGEDVGGDEDDDDLDLNNLVLEEVEVSEQRHEVLHLPPGLSSQQQSSQKLITDNFSSFSSENADEDFAAMCAALLTVPLTATTTATATSTSTACATASGTPPRVVAGPKNAKDNDKEKDKGKGGMLHVKVPTKTLPSSSIADAKSTAPPPSVKRNNNPNKQRFYSSGGGKRSSSNVYTSTSLTSSGEIPLIVIDAPNVAMRHGLNAKFSCKGIQLALNFFHSAGHKVIAFLPDYYLNFERVGELRRLASLNIGEVRASQLPDDIEVLQLLVQQGFVIGTPSQDYDDSYCITYAQRRGGYIISNDMYRDHVKRIESKEPREEARKWIKAHVISYTFVGDEFLPNPDASIFAR